MKRVMTDADLYQHINNLRSRMVESYFKKETVWTEDEWIHPLEFNNIIIGIINKPPITFKTNEEVIQYRLSEGIEE